MFGRELADLLGISQESVKGAIKKLVNENPSLKAELREIVGETGLRQVGEVHGVPIYAR